MSRRAFRRRAILPESSALAFFCTLDMIYTVFIIEVGLAFEANPLMAKFVANGWPAFVTAKTVTFLLPILIIEAIRPLSPHFIRVALRAGTLGYVAWYILLSLQVNRFLG